MTDDQIKYGVGGLLIGAVAVWFFMTQVAVPRTGNMMQPSRSAPQPMMNSGAHGLEAHFIEQMIPHHEDAITMSTIALERAQRPEIKQLAEAIIEAQTREIEQMKQWYQEWFDRELPTGDQVMQHHGMMSGSGLHMGMMGNQSDLDRLEQAEDFDRAFIEEMIPHHQMAVMMASMLQGGTEHPEMEQLAEDIILTQTQEIDQMRQWYTDWYSNQSNE